ncbi:hypothetical protein PV10_01432 [Exophiala mesophila]|uniref:4-coumarate-CoA ligase n=1 Tax=Exophiala mesophila TaxID=212818 RepID=A0A0D1ZUR7_EXOME|nr:uncharacterized protein PV10_01432 [Exophiala mesophila]KIV97719.1 hypothetical protein PV10_01432 [Exophiala mesophila]
MPIKSRWTIDIPRCSLPTFLFGSSANLPHAPNNPDKVYLAEAARPGTHFLTRASFQLWCQRFALGLRESGWFHPGDRLLLFSPNDIFVPVIFMGTIMAGGIFTGANPTFTSRELAYQLRDSGATLILCHNSALQTGLQAAKEARLDLSRVFVFDSAVYDGSGSGVAGAAYWGDLISANAEKAKHFVWDDLTGPGESDRILALNYSSGTTGFPKGVEISHLNYISNTMQTVYAMQLHPDYEMRKATGISLAYLPLYHAYGQTVYIASYFHHERTVLVMAKFDFVQMLEYVQKYKVTDLHLVPPIALALAKHPIVDKYDLRTVNFIGCGSAPLGRDIAEQVERRLNRKRKEEEMLNMKQGWGMTETTCSLLFPYINGVVNDNSVGEPLAGTEAMIVDEHTGKEITARGPEARGELWCRGLNIMKGYWKNPQATAETLTPDGWLKTGDIAYVTLAGEFVIVDRLKELIKVKGHQVAPAELEALLLEHPAINDAAVIGIPTPDGDESPHAFIVREPSKAGNLMTAIEIQKFVEAKVARYKRLSGGATFVEEIPRNPSGKILRRQLRDRYVSKKGYSARL